MCGFGRLKAPYVALDNRYKARLVPHIRLASLRFPQEHFSLPQFRPLISFPFLNILNLSPKIFPMRRRLPFKHILIILIASGILMSLTSCKKTASEENACQSVAQANLAAPDWTQNAVIYEVNTRQYSAEGTFKGVEAQLPRLRAMGVDIIWFMPVHPIGEMKRKGGMGSYYAVQDYCAVSSDYGTMDDFKSVVKKAHELGMKVIIDWVANHSAWDNAAATQHPDWYERDAKGGFLSPFDWTDVISFDYAKPEMRKWMVENLRFWLCQADIDGFRCDVAGEVPTDFWQQAAGELQKTKHVFLLAEADKPALHNKAFQASYGWKLMATNNDIAKGKKSALAIDTVFSYVRDSFATGFMMNFITNHDENSWNGTEFERYKGGVRTFAALTFTLPGMPLIYSGQESAFDHRLKFFEKDPIVWGNYSESAFYTSLTTLKHKHPALETDGEMIKVGTGQDNEVYAFLRRKGKDQVLVIANVTDKAQEILVNQEGLNGEFKDAFNGAPVYFNEAVSIKLKPWEYIIAVE